MIKLTPEQIAEAQAAIRKENPNWVPFSERATANASKARRTGKNGKTTSLYLSPQGREIALRLGNGNITKGIERALTFANNAGNLYESDKT